jgi:hypothetical protein
MRLGERVDPFHRDGPFWILEPELVEVRSRNGKPNGSAIGSFAYLVARMVCGCSVVGMSMLST